MLDSGCSVFLCSRRVAAAIELEGQSCTLEMALVAGEKTSSKEQEVQLRLASLKGDYITPIISAVTARTCIDPLPRVNLDPNQYPHLRDIAFTEQYPQETEVSIQLLIDTNTTMSILLPNPTMMQNKFQGPIAIPTLLGPVLGGQDITGSTGPYVKPQIAASVVSHDGNAKDEDMNSLCSRFYSMEDIGISVLKESPYTADEEAAVTMMKQKMFYSKPECRFYVPILFKADPKISLDSHWKVSYAMAQSSKRKAVKGGYIKEVDEAVCNMVSMGAAEVVPEHEIKAPHVHYLPTLAVRKDSQTTRVRITQNCSSVCRITQKSINSIMHTGPIGHYMPKLASLLIKFRCHRHILLADVAKEFWEIYYNKEDRNFVRFLYTPEERQEPVIFRQKGLVMGAVASPFQALYCISKLKEFYENQFPLAAEAIKDIYVDDVLACFDSMTQAAQTARQLINFFAKGSFTIHKFQASHEKILDMAKIEPEKRAKGKTTKVLGVQYNSETDEIEYDYSEAIKEAKLVTKRHILQVLATLFDPLGCCSPVTFTGKILVRTAWSMNLGWDEPITGSLRDDFLKWKNELKDLKHIKQPRLILPKNGKKPSLYMTSDASILGVGINAYCVSGDESNFIYSRTRVAPLKSLKNKAENLSIVRLELVGLVLASRCAKYLKEVLGQSFFQDTLFFCDSLINVARVRKNNPETYKQWTASRLQECAENIKPHQLFHTPGSLNPSDFSSRSGTSPNTLKNSNLWLHGPTYWKLPQDKWPQEVSLSKAEAAEMELLDKAESKIQVVSAAAVARHYFGTHNSLQYLIDKVSNYGRLNRSIAYIFRYLANKVPSSVTKLKCLENSVPGQKGNLTVPELRQATEFLIRREQRQAYEKELQVKEGILQPKPNSSLMQMGAFQDDKGLLRVVTRLDLSKKLPDNLKRPILLPKTELMQKYILYLHQMNGHITLSNMYYYLQRSYHVQGGRKQVQKCIRQCRTTNCQKPRQLNSVVPPLPTTRIDGDELSVFSSVGMDHFGPLYFKAEPTCDKCEQLILKTWGLIIVCFQTRYIHIELCRSLSTEDFLWSFSNFCALRGTPSYILADNSKTFKAGSKELHRIYRNLDWSKITQEMTLKKINFEFSIEKAPQTNSVTERMIQFVKKSLSTTLAATSNLRFAHLNAVLQQCAAWTNDRPLFAQSECYDKENDIVTPSLLVNARFLSVLPHDDNARMTDDLKKFPFSRMNIYRRTLARKYFTAWRKLYLVGMQATKFCKKGEDPPLHIDQIVMYNENSFKPRYKLGRITALLRSEKDNQIRRVRLKIPTGSVIDRHISHISILEADVPDRQNQVN